MILAGEHNEGESVFLLVFEGKAPIGMVQDIIDDLGLNARVEEAKVTPLLDAFFAIARVLGAEMTINSARTEVTLQLDNFGYFNAKAVKEYLEMVTGASWEIERVKVGGRELFAKFVRRDD